MTEERGPLSFDTGGEGGEEREPFALEQEQGPAEPPQSAPPAGTFRYGWVVGLAFIVVIALVTINTLRTGPGGSAGLAEGTPLPPFAMPLALSQLSGDANVARTADSGEAGKRPACAVRGPSILNSCELAGSGKPVVIAFFASRSGSACDRELDRLERARRAHPEIRFAAVAIRGNRGDLRKEIRARDWRFPVGYDHDGVVANLFRVAVCPTVTFATPGGIVSKTTVGELGDRGFTRELAALERRSA
jgi:hypothetical protein